MTNTLIGQDVEGMRRLESVLRDGEGRLSSVRIETHSIVDMLFAIWRGEVMSMFSMLWQNQHARSIESAEQSLRIAAEHVRRNIEQQVETSNSLSRGDYLYQNNVPSGRVDLADPDFDDDSGASQHIAMDPESQGLFGPPGEGRQPSMSDIDQRSLGDCWLLATLAKVADSDPEHIANMIQDNGDGTFDVTLFVRDENGRLVERVITVDNEFAAYGDGSYAYSQPVDGAVWPLVIEKAYAEAMGSDYDSINGGWMDNAMETIYGTEASRLSVDQLSDQELVNQLSDPSAAVATFVEPTSEQASAIVDHDAIAAHAYAVRDVVYRDGQWMVELYNPHGSTSLTPPPLTLDEFRSAYGTVSVLDR